MRGNGERGAAAVEFALIVPILLAVLVGLIDYGLWWRQTDQATGDATQAARTAAAGEAPVTAACPAGGTATDRAACHMRKLAGTSTRVYVSVTGPTGIANDWRAGGDLLLCATLPVDALTGLTPMPHNGWLRTQVHAPIQTNRAGGVAPHSDTPPPGGDWTWCG